MLDRRNPFDEYDDVKFRQRFRLSKFAVTKLLDEVFYRTYYNILFNVKNWLFSFCGKASLSP